MCGSATPHFVVKHDHHKWLLAAVVVRKNARLSTSDLFAASHWWNIILFFLSKPYVSTCMWREKTCVSSSGWYARNPLWWENMLSIDKQTDRKNITNRKSDNQYVFLKKIIFKVVFLAKKRYSKLFFGKKKGYSKLFFDKPSGIPIFFWKNNNF